MAGAVHFCSSVEDMVARAHFLLFTAAQTKQQVFLTSFYSATRLLQACKIIVSPINVSAVVKCWQLHSDMCWRIYCCLAFHNDHTSWQNRLNLCGRPLKSLFNRSGAHAAVPQAVQCLPACFFSAKYLDYLTALLVAPLIANCLQSLTPASTHCPWLVSFPHPASTAPFNLSLYVYPCFTIFNLLLVLP